MEIKIVSKKPTSKSPVIIQGFPGVGLVGSIATKYITEKLKVKQIGYIESPHLPPLSFIHEGDVYNAIRIYEIQNSNIIIITSEFPVPANLIYDLGDAITKWVKEIKGAQLICLEGINAQNPKETPRVFGIDANVKTPLPKSLEPVKTGYILGVSAAVMLKCKDKKIRALCLMAESHANYPDGLAAASLLEKLREITGLDIDTKPLKKEAESFEDKIKQIIEKAKEIKTDKEDDRIYG